MIRFGLFSTPPPFDCFRMPSDCDRHIPYKVSKRSIIYLVFFQYKKRSIVFFVVIENRQTTKKWFFNAFSSNKYLLYWGHKRRDYRLSCLPIWKNGWIEKKWVSHQRPLHSFDLSFLPIPFNYIVRKHSQILINKHLRTITFPE